MQDRHLLVKISERLRLGIELLKSGLQNLGLVVGATHERPIAIGTDRALRELGAGSAGREPASTALQTAGDSVADSLLRHFQPDREIKRGVQPFQDGQ